MLLSWVSWARKFIYIDGSHCEALGFVIWSYNSIWVYVMNEEPFLGILYLYMSQSKFQVALQDQEQELISIRL